MTKLDIAVIFCLTILLTMFGYIIYSIIKSIKFEKFLNEFRTTLKAGDAVSIYGTPHNAKITSVNLDGTVNITISNIHKDQISIPNQQ